MEPGDQGRPGVAVLVVNYRTPDLTARAVTSVLDDPHLAEVVVVDNASGDSSPDQLRRAFAARDRVTVVESAANGGFGAGINLAAHRSTAPLLFVLNSDAVLGRAGLAPLVGTLADHPEVGVVAPLVLDQDGRPQPDAFGRLPRPRALDRGWARARDPGELRPGWVSGVAMMLRRRDFEAVGGFDEDFWMYLEDVDLCRRLAAAGLAVARQPAATVAHLGGASSQGRAQRRARYHRSRLLYLDRIGASRTQLVLAAALGRARAASERASRPRRTRSVGKH